MTTYRVPTKKLLAVAATNLVTTVAVTGAGIVTILKNADSVTRVIGAATATVGANMLIAEGSRMWLDKILADSEIVDTKEA